MSEPSPSAPRAALAGIVAVGVALTVIELAAALTVAVPSAVEAVGQQVIPLTPEPVVRWAIDTFGASDIAVLNAGTTTIALLLGAGTGVVARQAMGLAALTFVGFASLGLLAAAADGGSSASATAAVSGVAVLVGLGVLRQLLARAAPADPGVTPGGHRADRRRFLVAAGSLAVAAVVTAATARAALRDTFAVVDPSEVALPAPARSLPPPPEAATVDAAGVAPLHTPTDRFFVIDTAVATPQVDPDTWTLRIHGLVDREVELDLDRLLNLPLVEVDATLACVSNEVGGELVGTARWLGVPLRMLLEEAGVGTEAEQVIGRAVDGFTAGFPIEAALDDRQALVAVAMNGEPLPTRHGFPARLVVPGLFGYVSATKWLSEIELTTWDTAGYWVPRGWARHGPIKTQSRIDVPRVGETVGGAPLTVAGAAYAPLRGVDEVEVRVDDGPWTPAELGAPLSEATWVQWVARLEVGAGEHRVQVRARDGAGQVQPQGPTPPAPDGAEGWHAVAFRVR